MCGEHHSILANFPVTVMQSSKNDSLGVRAVVDAQNVLTEGVLAQCDTRNRFKALMTQLYDYPRFGWDTVLEPFRSLVSAANH